MSWSLRARLTTWYTAIVVAVLATGAVVETVAHYRLGLQRVDQDLERLMLTLVGVMHNEINEGLTMVAAAKEASIEVIAPDRSLFIGTAEVPQIVAWGKPLPGAWSLAQAVTGLQTIDFGEHGRVRLFRRDVTYKGRAFVAAAGMSLDDLEARRSEFVLVIAIGVAVGLVVAGLGGWWVGKRNLQPLTDMATQVASRRDQTATRHLTTPRPDDELGRLAAAFNALLDRLAAVLNAQRQFMADASHELRTPVSIVRTTAQVALTQPDRPGEDYRESLAIVEEQTGRLTRLVDGMFLLARADAVGVPVTRELLYLDDLIAECARGVQVLADNRQVTIHQDLASEVAFNGDAALLRRMITNLLDNAVRHARSGGRVSVSLRRDTQTLTISVKDDGPGVPAADRERIFERFVRREAGYDGAGLGLAIARWVAETHGGGLVLAPNPPPGAEFIVTLPRVPV